MPFKVMVTLGESTTAGGAATRREHCWASVLAQLINEFQDEPVRLINSGIGANVLSPRSRAYLHSGRPSALERVQEHVIDHHPDLVVISYGFNDMRCGTQVEQFHEDMQCLVDQVQTGTEALIVLLNTYFMTAYKDYGPHWDKGSLERAELYNGTIRELAAENGLLFADVFAAEGKAPWVIDPDGVHANDLGHRLIAHCIFGVLATHCSALGLKVLREAQDYPRWRDESVLKRDYGDS